MGCCPRGLYQGYDTIGGNSLCTRKPLSGLVHSIRMRVQRVGMDYYCSTWDPDGNIEQGQQ